MSEAYRLKKITQHNNYYIFLVMMCVLIVSIGAVGIIGYFGTSDIQYTILAAIGIILCIFAILSPEIKNRIIYPIRGI